MEQDEENKQMDYWLVQYQKLLDSKPTALIDREVRLEPAVIKVLCRSAAENYMPAFARHRILAKQLPHLTEEDLQKVSQLFILYCSSLLIGILVLSGLTERCRYIL